MIVDTTGDVTQLPGFNTPVTVGAVLWTDGIGDSASWNNLKCLGKCSVDGIGLSADLAISGSAFDRSRTDGARLFGTHRDQDGAWPPYRLLDTHLDDAGGWLFF